MSADVLRGLQYIRDAGSYAHLEETIHDLGIELWWVLLQTGLVLRDDRGRVTLTVVGRARLAAEKPVDSPQAS